MCMITTRIRIGVFLLLVTSTLYAQNNRSAVSVNGSDSNPCTTVSPCRSFATAMTKTNAGGEVIAIDSGGYGAFTISKSVSVIAAPGVHAAITVGSGDGIAVAGTDWEYVKIRGVAITLTTTDGRGIYATTFRSLTIENCSVYGGHDGIVIHGTGTGHTTIADTVVRAADNIGYDIDSTAALIRCRAQECSNVGLYVSNTATVSGIVSAVEFAAVRNIVGVSVYSTNFATLSLDRALITNNWNQGITTYGDPGPAPTGFLYITNSMVTGNTVGMQQTFNSTLGSMKNNMVIGNGTNTFGAITPLTGQ